MSQRSTELHAEDAGENADARGESQGRRAGEVRPISAARPGVVREAGNTVPGPAEPTQDAALLAALTHRVERAERHNRWLRYALVLVFCLTCYASFEKLFPEGVVVQQTLMESKELKLVDSAGNARLFLRMYSRVPVLQIVDSNGKPRLSLGLRFDDTPFIDLSDKRGNTRATLEMTEEDSPALRLFDEQGDVTFNIN